MFCFPCRGYNWIEIKTKTLSQIKALHPAVSLPVHFFLLVEIKLDYCPDETGRAPPHLNFLWFLSFQQGPASFLQKLPPHSDLDTLVECPPRQMAKTKVRNMKEHMEEIFNTDRFPSCKTFRLTLTQTQTHTSVFLASETEFVTPLRPTWIFCLVCL